MTPRIKLNSLLFWDLVVLIGLTSMCPGTARADGSYVYYEDSYATEGDSDYISGDGCYYSNGTAVVSFMVVDAYVIHALFRNSRRGSCIMG